MKVSPSKHGLLKKAACWFLAILLIYVASSVISSIAVFHYIFKRTDYPRTFEISYVDIDNARYPREAVSFSSGINTLKGYLYKKENAPGTIIVVNGIFSGADRHLAEIMFFLDNGWQVFSFDGTGIGESDGDGIIGLQQTKLDLLAAIAAIKQSQGDTPIVLYGHSAGGYAAVTALDAMPDIAAVVSIAGFNSPVETMYFHARQKVGFLASIEYPFLWLQNRVTFGEDANLTAIEVLDNTDTPVMIIEGSGDTVVPGDIGIGRYCGQCKNPNVRYCYVDTLYRNSHTTIWLSSNAAKQVTSASKEEPAALPADTRTRMNEVDSEFLLGILEFYTSAVAG